MFVVPGHAEESITLHLGQGRRRGGRVALDVGVDAYVLRTSEALHHGTGLVAVATGARRELATTQQHQRMEGRDLVREGTLEDYRRDPGFAHAGEHGGDHLPTLYPAQPYAGHAWGMAIDLATCIGCNACVAACVAENNIPVVGADQVRRGREMHWIRIDTYYTGDLDNPRTLYQPVPCMHCENAPCEVVCPVNATVHSSEGLNDMVYNRCVGTRYCSNNCPYKVRRFNFLKWVDTETEVLKLARNPEVTVRGRGVMEKCTFCVQRINDARQKAKVAGRRIADGEIKTACQQVCPSDAIVFGDLNDPAAEVVRRKSQPLDYGLLAELNTRPRASYLARVTNPNPDLAREAAANGHARHA